MKPRLDTVIPSVQLCCLPALCQQPAGACQDRSDMASCNGSSVEGIASWSDDESPLSRLFSSGWFFILTHGLSFWSPGAAGNRRMASLYEYFHSIFLWSRCTVTGTGCTLALKLSPAPLLTYMLLYTYCLFIFYCRCWRVFELLRH